MGTVECGISRNVMRDLKNDFRTDKWSRTVVRVREGRGIGVLFLTAWMLHEISPRLSGNYHVFSGAGNYPRRRSLPRFETRKGLRARINRAKPAGIIEKVEKPVYIDRLDAKAGDPPNAAPDPAKRLDIPLIGWKPDSESEPDVVLIPTSWRDRERYHAQIHPTATFRLSGTSGAEVATLIKLGETILDRVPESVLDELGSETTICWGNLNTFIKKQHSETVEHCKFELENFEAEIKRPSLKRTASALYLASSLTRLWPPAWVIGCAEATNLLKSTAHLVPSNS